jgi:hypothetical protein
VTETQPEQETTDTASEPVSGEVTLSLTAVFENPDRDTPVFNETVTDLREQLPSLSTHDSPAAPDEASEQPVDDSGDGDQD